MDVLGGERQSTRTWDGCETAARVPTKVVKLAVLRHGVRYGAAAAGAALSVSARRRARLLLRRTALWCGLCTGERWLPCAMKRDGRTGGAELRAARGKFRRSPFRDMNGRTMGRGERLRCGEGDDDEEAGSGFLEWGSKNLGGRAA